ncbi:MAG: histidine phosphatase family protein [Leptolyngbyaceae cyanobacterium MO_188.B28]|nr:histidine phosphatase family protein [Leptolyngbyaceae cyanobacterium MO_188.B28]
MLKLYLCRHGNTFEPGDKVVWVGKNEDAPLAKKGLAQASAMASYLQQQSDYPVAFYCSDLQRTRRYAEIIKDDLGLEATIMTEPALNELDYGDWGGRTTDEIITQYGESPVKQWQENSIFPPPGLGNWGDTAEAVDARIEAFVSRLISLPEKERSAQQTSPIAIVSSNGVLRFFLKLIPGEFERGIAAQTFKMKTGHFSVLLYDGQNFQLMAWNQNPLDLPK